MLTERERRNAEVFLAHGEDLKARYPEYTQVIEEILDDTRREIDQDNQPVTKM